MGKSGFFRADPLERFNGQAALAAVSAVLGFAVLFLGSPPRIEDRMPAGAADVRAISLEGQEIPAIPEEAALDGSLPRDEGLWYQVYIVRKGDTLSQLAEDFNVTVDTLVSFNEIKNSRALRIGTYLKVPSMNGIIHSASSGETLDSIAAKYEISLDRMVEANNLKSEELYPGKRLFLPDARLSSFTLREINGDLFKWPIRGWITSWYGWRDDPFTGARSFHTGVDIGAARGAPVRAAMEGRVSSTGYNSISGNYVILSHHSGYATLYAHLDRISVKKGQRIAMSSVIGTVGTTGYSTGPHLHFTVMKNGRTINPMLVLH